MCGDKATATQSVGAVEKGQERETNGAEEELQDPNILDFDGPNDPEHPLNRSTTRKTTTIAIVSMTAVLSPIGSTISAAAVADIMHHFDTTDETLGALMTTIYLLGFAFGPLDIAPLSELYGRAIMFRSCTLLSTVFNIACAVANIFGSLVVYRLLVGIAGSCAGTLGASSVTDLIPREKRGRIMFAYIMGPTLGPTIGPIIGGNLTAAAGWRVGASEFGGGIIGGVTGGVAQAYTTMGFCTCMKTVDITKHKMAASGQSVSIWVTFMDIYRRGGLRGINKGVHAVAIRQMTNWGTRFGLSRLAEQGIRKVTH
ncbi:MFS general substrate transporter [Colletotrichum somersetense]|nr:MFS general substrate transporter [Colletotrichum somersetense]